MTSALYLRGAHDAVVLPTNLREGKPGETLLKIAAVGLCGSDLHYYKDGGIGSARIGEPFVPGHEFSGWLTEDIPDRELKRGTLVAVDPNHPCGHCAMCRAGYFNLCLHTEFIGSPPNNGAMTDKLWVRQSQIVVLPPEFTPADGAMLEPLGVAIHAVDLARPRLLESVTILGCGPIGLLVLQVLRTVGVGEIFCIDPQAHRRAMAERFGATRTAADVAGIQGSTKGAGTSLVIEATNSPNGFRDAVRCASVAGRLVLVGIPDGDTYALPASEARRRALKIKFARRMGEVYPRAIALVKQRRVDVEALVTRRFPLSEAAEAFRQHAANTPGLIKSLIVPSDA